MASLPRRFPIWGAVPIVLLAIALRRRVWVNSLLYFPLLFYITFSSAIILLLVAIARSDARRPGISLVTRQRHALRPLSFTTPSAWSAILTRQAWEQPGASYSPSIHRSASTALNARLDQILELVKSSFILPWYRRLSPSPAFPNALDSLLRLAAADITKRTEAIDWPSILVGRILPIVTDHLHHYRSIEHLSNHSSRPTRDPSLPLPLPKRLHPAFVGDMAATRDGSLPSIEMHLRSQLARAFGQTLPENEQSEVLKTMMKEIVLGTILLPIFDMISESDFWNRQIDERGGRYLHEQKQVNRFLSALSSMPAPTSSPKASKSPRRPMQAAALISANSSSKQFDAFVKSIGKLRTLGEARRLRADIERELRLAKLSVAAGDADHEPAEKFARLHKYIRRLERAKGQVDRRIAELSQTASLTPGGKIPDPSATPSTVGPGVANLQAVLADPASLAYWMEHMERRGRSRLVQFWLTIEGLKNPLQAVNPLAGPDDLITEDWTNDATLQEDIAFLAAAYLANPGELNVPQTHMAVIKQVAQQPSTELHGEDARRAKQAVFGAQGAVFEQMEEEDWPEFSKSELFVKASADIQKTTRAQGAVGSPLLSPKPAMSPYTGPPAPARHVSAPNVPGRHTFKPPPESPIMLTKPILANGSITPGGMATPLAALSTQAPFFGPPLDTRQLSTRSVSDGQVSAGPPGLRTDGESLSTSSSMLATPHAPVRRSSHLESLLSPTDDRVKLFEEEETLADDDDFIEVQRMEAIQAALEEIIASDEAATTRSKRQSSVEPTPDRMASSLVLSPPPKQVPQKLSSRSVDDFKALRTAQASTSSRGSPSIVVEPAARPTSPRRSSSKLSSDKPAKALFDDEMVNTSDEEDPDAHEPNLNVTQMATGNLNLSSELTYLQETITELVKQEHLLSGLIRQAELTGSSSELRILRKSLSSVRRDQRTAIFQKAQLEVQEDQNRLEAGRTQISIPSATISDESEGRVARYVVEIRQVDGGTMVVAWRVARRYNDFFELDRSLKDMAERVHGSDDSSEIKAVLQKADIPGKRLLNVSASFVEGRRVALERYLQTIVAYQAICKTQQLRSFLSRQTTFGQEDTTLSDAAVDTFAAGASSLTPHNIVKSLYRTMATSLDDALPSSTLDMMYSTLSRQLTDVASGLNGVISSEDLQGLGASFLTQMPLGPYTPSWLRAEDTVVPPALQKAEVELVKEGAMPTPAETSFTSPICDLFIEMFDLKENNWLRRQAIVVILQQFLGSTVERRVRETFRQATSMDALERHLTSLQDSMWPGGVRRPSSTPRSEAEKAETKIAASRKLGLLIPDVAANMIGRSNARRAARRVFGVLQDRRLNQHLMLMIIDEVFDALYTKP